MTQKITVVMNSFYVNTKEMVAQTVTEWNDANPHSPVTHIGTLDYKEIPVDEFLR